VGRESLVVLVLDSATAEFPRTALKF
jgi:hypothetical protein